MNGSIAAREQYLRHIRELPELVERGDMTEIEAEGIKHYLWRAILAETPAHVTVSNVRPLTLRERIIRRARR